MRAFLAVHPDGELKRRLAEEQSVLRESIERSPDPRVRLTWVRPETIHLTVAFLGEIAEDLAGSLRDSVIDASAGRKAIAVPMSTIGTFPRPAAPRTLWFGPGASWERTDPAARLLNIVTTIVSATQALGIVADRQTWHPHLTVARVRQGQSAVGRVLAETGILEKRVNLPPLLIEGISLMKSELLPEGPRHTTLWTVA